MKIALITGASKGIGRECALLFAEKGYLVFAGYNKNKEEAEKIKSGSIIPVFCDVSDKNSVFECVEKIKKEYGEISVLVNNAGVALPQKLITDVTDEEWDKIFDVNVKGMFNVTKAVLPMMINKKYGSIVNISSIWGITGGSCEVPYSASKAAVIGFTKALAKEVGPSNVRVNCIAPGVIKTDMNKNLSEEDYEALKEETPLERIGNTKDVARAVLFLANDDSSFVTGEVLNVSGGITM